MILQNLFKINILYRTFCTDCLVFHIRNNDGLLSPILTATRQKMSREADSEITKDHLRIIFFSYFKTIRFSMKRFKQRIKLLSNYEKMV